MKKFILLFIIFILTLPLSGCIFDLDNWITPDDTEFLALIQELDTPQKICAYMKENFTYKAHYFYAPDPYTFWKIKEGDCNDFATFAIFVANYHNYETYQIHIFFKRTFIKEFLPVYLEDNKYTYSNIKAYYPLYVSNFDEIVSHYFSFPIEYELNYYKVFDYNMNLIEQGTNN